MYSGVAADDVILRAPARRGPKNLFFFLLEDGNPNQKRILRCAQNDTLLSLYRNDENALILFCVICEICG